MDIIFSNISKVYHVRNRQGNLFRDLFIRKSIEKVALSDVSFQIKEGEIVGYIGPNGAGKSTTIKIMTGILKPSSGFCRVLNVDPTENRIQFVRKVGAVFGNRSNLMWDLPVLDSINLMQKIYKIPQKKFKENRVELVSLLEIEDLLSIPVRQLSLGQRMRCEIIVALLHDPEILFLDEPTLGLDARSKLAVHRFIKTINLRRRMTVVLTTHDMNDIEALTDRVIIIGKGKKLFDGDFVEIKNRFANFKKVTIKFNASHQLNKIVKKIQENFEENILSEQPNEMIAEFREKSSKFSELLAYLSTSEVVCSYQIQSLTIEEIIARYYTELDI
ncbi:hypothetical protein A5886_001732 [Enterococcus sp. 8G7_MSG3316]|uniref:ABC transporter domain-containing protein n=1 Tax=Candidatus Enterococcus testudinis TaxID=1834191 RepID=A0A242A6K6_9ENTE|nr:ATP-binding cassette domain-containing protein [Enterococcus sp. 8G7_MSG3316]OTN76654.1 hypothetical protein A5886_001732 [Enterococcus sp. 8G7_MSG3316]